MSEVFIENINVSNCKVGITGYQKKSEFGPASITVKKLTENNIAVSFLLEERSKLYVDEKAIETYQKNVERKLYPVEYGNAGTQLSL